MGVRINDGGLHFDVSLDNSQLEQQMRVIEQRFNQLGNTVRQEGSSMESLARKAAGAAAVFFSAQAAENFVSSIIKVRSQFQQLEVSFSTMLKSKAAADTLMKELVVFAGTTPFGIKEAAAATKQLLAYGSTAKTVVGELRMLGDVASGVSVPIGDLVYLYGTLKSQGRAYAVDIRQFAGRGIPIYEELAKVLGVVNDQFGTGTEKVMRMVEAGKVGFPEVEKAFKNMTSAGGMFGGLMEAQSKTFTGQIERLKDAWDVMLNTMGKSNEGLFNDAISAASSMVENYQQIVDMMGVVVGAYAIYKTTLLSAAAFQKAYEVSTIGMAIAVNQESVAHIANANATAAEMRVTVSNLAAKKTAAIQTAFTDAALVQSATQRLVLAEAANAAAAREVLASTRLSAAKTLQAATEEVVAAKEKAAISRKAALAASSEFYTAKQNLETTAKVASSAATVELTGVESINAAGKKALASATAVYNAVLAASPVIAFTAVLTALGVVIYSLTKVTNEAEEAQRALNAAREDGNKASDKELSKVEQLVAVLKDHKATVDQQKEAYDKLQESSGGVLKAYSAEQIAAGKAAKGIDAYIKKINEAAAARTAFAQFNELDERLKALDRKGVDALGTWTRLGRGLKNIFTTVTTKELNDAIVSQEREVITGTMAKLKKEFGDKFSEMVTGKTADTKPVVPVKNKAFYESLVKKYTEDLDSLDRASKTFERDAAPIKKKIQDAQRALLSFNVTKPGKADSEGNAALKRRNDMLKKIYELNEKYNTKSLTDDQQKLQEIRNDFTALKKDIDSYNANPKNKKINPDLKPALEKVLTDQEYRNDTEKIKVQLDKQKQLYADFEEVRKTLGEKKAIERYQQEIDVSKSYLEVLSENFDKTTGDSVSNGMTGPIVQRLDIMKKEISETQKANQDAYHSGITSLQSYEEQRIIIIENYNRKKVEMIKNGDSTEILDEEYNNDLQKLGENAFQKLKSYKDLFNGIEGLSKANARIVIKNAEDMLLKLKEKIKNGTVNVDPAFIKNIEKGIKSSKESLDDSPKQLQNIGAELTQIGSLVGDIDDGLSRWLGTLGGVVSNIGQVKQSISDMKEAQQTGDTLGGVSAGLKLFVAGISIIKGVFSLFDRSAQREAQAAYARDLQLKQNEAITKALERQLALIKDVYGVERLTKYAKGIQDIKSAMDQTQAALSGKYTLTDDKTINKYIEKINNGEKINSAFQMILDKMIEKGVIRKVTGDLEQLTKLMESGRLDSDTSAMVQQLINLQKQYNETTNALKEDATGTTFQELTSEILSMFESGNIALEDFADNFEKVMKRAVLNSFKRNVIDKEMQPFFDALYKAGADGKFTKEEKSSLAELDQQIRDRIKAQFEGYKGLIGEDKEGSGSNSLKGSIQANLTEETGTIIAGNFAGFRLAQLETNLILRPMGTSMLQLMGIAQSQLNVALRIEGHVKRSADTTDDYLPFLKFLKSIDSKLSDSGNAGRAMGIRG